jgi:hypothetical protein
VRRAVVIIFVTCWAALLVGYEDGGATLPVLEFGAGARAFGMGGAHVAMVEDASATYWNPAGLYRIRKKEISLLYARLFAPSNYYYAAYAHPVDGYGTIGASLLVLNTPGIEKTDAFGAGTGDTFADNQVVVNFSYAQPLYNEVYGFPVFRDFTVGMTMKILTHSMDVYSAAGVGVDLGLLWEPAKLLKGFAAGLNVQNLLSPNIQLNNENRAMPVNFKIGAAQSFLYDTLSFAGDLDFQVFPVGSGEERSLDYQFRYHVGAEYWFVSMLGARVGFSGLGFSEIEDFSGDVVFGASFRVQLFQFDYVSLVNLEEDLGLTHMVTATLRFGKLTPR